MYLKRRHFGFILFYSFLEVMNCYLDVSNASTVFGSTLDPEKHPNWKNLDHTHCGDSTTGRIVGGENADIGEFPWIVLLGEIFVLQWKPQKVIAAKFSCGGSLLSRYYVLTAEHCFSPPDVPTHVRAGEYDLTTAEDCYLDSCAPPFQDREIEVFYTYSGTTPAEDEFSPEDIAILKVKEPFELNGYVMPICLPTKDVVMTPLGGTVATVAGWGLKNSVEREHATILQKLKMEIREDYICELMFQWIDYRSDLQICGGGELLEAACNGDSGGPLFTRANLRANMKPQFVILGVVSFGEAACGYTHFPIIYARVTAFLNWILDHIEIA